MKNTAAKSTNNTISVMNDLPSSIQPSSRHTSQDTLHNGADTHPEPILEPSSKSKKKKKKKKKKSKLNSQQPSTIPMIPLDASFDAQSNMDVTVTSAHVPDLHQRQRQCHHNDGELLTTMSFQNRTRVNNPPSPPPPPTSQSPLSHSRQLPTGSLSHHYYQQYHMSSAAKSITPNSATTTIGHRSDKHKSNSTTLGTALSSTKKSHDKDEFWSTSMDNTDERQRIREFWLQLGEDERRSLVKVEKEAVLRKMKEQQKHSCNCSVCGKKRTAIEDELEVLYDAYYEELEQYANHQQYYAQRTLHGYPAVPTLQDSYFEDCLDDDVDEDDDDDRIHVLGDHNGDENDGLFGADENGFDTHLDDEHNLEISDDDFSDSYQDEVEKLEANRLARRANTGGGDYFNFGNSLTVKGGILTVADDLLKNDGKKFLDMMERLAERRLQRDDEVHLDQDIEYYDDEEDDDDEIYEDENEEDVRTEVQRMEEGRRMFQIFAARMFEQRVLAAYREKVAKERQQRLLQELEEEDRQRQDRELKKQRDKELKKDRKRQLKQQQEQERLAKEAQRLADEAKKRAEQQQKVDNDRQKRELERQKKNDERRIKEEEKRLKEEDKRRRLKEEKERIAEKERQRKEKEEVDHREKEFLKEKERREKELKDELARRDRELREQILHHNRQVKGCTQASDHITNTSQNSIITSTSSDLRSTPAPTALSSLSTSASIIQSDTCSSPSVESPHINSDALKHQFLIPNPTLLLDPIPSSDLQQTTLFSPPSQPFSDILQPSHPFLAPQQLDNVLPPLASAPSLCPEHQPLASSIGVLPSAFNIDGTPFHHTVEQSLSSQRSSFKSCGQLYTPNSSPSSTVTTSSPKAISSNTVTSPSISIPSNHVRRSSAAAGPIGSPVINRCHEAGSESGLQETNGALETGNHQVSANTGGGTDHSLFSNFLFGESNKGTSSITTAAPIPHIDGDLTDHHQSISDKFLDREVQFSMESSAHEWKNGWSATTMITETIHDKLFGDTLVDQHSVLLERAKAAYRKLDEISRITSFLDDTTTYHTLIQLHQMINDLYCDTQIDIRELHGILAQSPQSGFQCTHHHQHGIVVTCDLTSTTSATAIQTSQPSTITTPSIPSADHPLLLRRSSVLSHNALSPTSLFPSDSLPNNINSSLSHNTNTIPPSLSSSHTFLNPPPRRPSLSLPQQQQQYHPFLPTNSLPPPLLSTTPFAYSSLPSHIQDN